MASRDETGEIVKRALAYPYSSPGRSFLYLAGEAQELPADLDPAGRTPLLAYGANAAPEALGRKLADLRDRPLPVLLAELDGFDVVYSAHLSPYGAVPATLRPSAGTSVRVHVAYPDADQLPLLCASEPNYELTRLGEVSCRVDGVGALDRVAAFASRHGCLRVDGAPVALAAVPARRRRLASMTEPEILELVRSQLAPELDLEQFVAGCAQGGGIAPLPALRTR